MYWCHEITYLLLLECEWPLLELLCSRSLSRCLSLLDDLWWWELLLLDFSFTSELPLFTTEWPLLTPFSPFIVLISCLAKNYTDQKQNVNTNARKHEKKTFFASTTVVLFESTRQWKNTHIDICSEKPRIENINRQIHHKICTLHSL